MADTIVENMHRAMIGVKHNQGRHAQAKAAFNVVEPELERLRAENARLREALNPITGIKAFTCCYEWVPVEALRDDEEVSVRLTGAQIKDMRTAARAAIGESDV